MLACRALNASANPPAKLGALLPSGVALPLSPPLLPPFIVILTALSLGAAGAGTGFLPPAVTEVAGRFDGGAGGAGFAFAETGRLFVDGGGREGGGAGVGAGRWTGSSFKYAEGVQPSEEPSSFLASHQPR